MDAILDVEAVTPLYVQLMTQLETGIRSGSLKAGERLETERDMADHYGVSIITVRKAVKELVDRGLVEKQQGKGTYVSKTKITRDFKNLLGFSEMCRRQGLKPGGRMLKNELVNADPKICRNLGIPENSQCVHLKRLRLADDQPVAIEENYFPLQYSMLLNETFNDNSMLAFLKEKFDVTIAISEKWIELCTARAREAQYLEIARGTPLMYIKSVAYTAKKEPIYYGTQIFNGEKHSFYIYQANLGI